jgi:hypothetical protein
MADLSLSVAPGSAANGWNTTPVNLSAPGVLDWYVANNTNWGQTADPDVWDWTHTYTTPGNEKAGASILSNYNLGYTISGSPEYVEGWTGAHTIDVANKVLFSYTDGVAPVSETDVLARTNWMSDSDADGIMSLRAEVGANQLYVTQWFNYSDEWEGWPKGHTLTATLYNASNTLVDQDVWSAPSGLAEGFINPYTATISVQGSNAGDYLILEHSTSNIGYRGTMVAVPVPAAVILGILGLGAAGLKLRKFA